MELYQLEYFLEAARQRNFTRAAARLNLAQAALSEQIRKLELELGTSLFQRGRRETVLSPAGETLRHHAEGLLEHAAAARLAVQELVGLRGGRLRIACIPSVSACVLPDAIADFRGRYPLVELALFEGTSEAVAQWIESGRVEFGIVQLPASTAGFEEQLLFVEPFVLLVGKGHPMSARGRIDLCDFAREPFVLYKGRARDTALAACRAAGFEPRISCESSELETVRSLVGAGLGVSVLPRLAAQSAQSRLAKCRALEMSSPRVERQVAILNRTGHQLSPAAVAFREVLSKRLPEGGDVGVDFNGGARASKRLEL
jgi:DNA-binding transcriptional LysR family regulator